MAYTLDGRKRKTGDYGLRKCAICHIEMRIHTPTKKFCGECMKIRDRERKKYKYHNDGKTKERIAISSKRWQEKNKDKILKYGAEWKKRNKKKVNARNMASKYIQLGDQCEICKSKVNLQRHHWSYDKPLLVNTLCSYCHNIQHVKKPKEAFL